MSNTLDAWVGGILGASAHMIANAIGQRRVYKNAWGIPLCFGIGYYLGAKKYELTQDLKSRYETLQRKALQSQAARESV